VSQWCTNNKSNKSACGNALVSNTEQIITDWQLPSNQFIYAIFTTDIFYGGKSIFPYSQVNVNTIIIKANRTV